MLWIELFLISVAIIWIAVASICDLKNQEIPNWLSFSLIIFILAFRAFYSSLNADPKFFLFGLGGFAIFFILSYLFYYARVFAAGDSKLLMALGPVIPLSHDISTNVGLIIGFIVLLLFAGGIYGLLYTFYLLSKDWERFSKEFSKQSKVRKRTFIFSLCLFFLSLILVYYSSDPLLLVFSLIIILSPVLFVYSKAIENCFMIEEVSGKELSVGDWLAEEVKVGKKKIKPYWQGLSEKEVKKLSKKRKIKIKQGVPFIPAFFLAFVLFAYLWHSSGSFLELFRFLP